MKAFNTTILLLSFATLTLIGCAHQSSPSVPPSDAAAPTPTATPGWTQTPQLADVNPYGATVDGPLPNLLVVGDSISAGYTGPLYRKLINEFDVHHSFDNDRNTFYTLNNFSKWQWPNDTTIVWNNGLWDACRKDWHDQYAPDQPLEWYGSTLADYETRLVQIARMMKATGARVIFMTTTDIQFGASGVFEMGREVLLNEIAKRVLPPEGIEVYDLWKLTVAIPGAHLNQWEVHFTVEANKQIADFVAQAVRREIPPVAGPIQ